MAQLLLTGRESVQVSAIIHTNEKEDSQGHVYQELGQPGHFQVFLLHKLSLFPLG